MKALKEAWFEFKGVNSADMGVMLLARPQRTQPDANGERIQVSGRSGRLWLGDGTWDNASAEVSCIVPEGDMDDVLNWLTGSGWLRFSDEPERAYRARVINGIVRTQPYARFAAQRFSVAFDCQPFRYLYPAAEELELTQGGNVQNPGTAASCPKIWVYGSGDIALYVGAHLLAFEDVSDGVAVDCELMEVLNLTETELLNGCAQIDEFPQLEPGANAVSWSGAVEKVVIEPRWRYI